MGWARQYQLTAETRSLADVLYYSGAAGWASQNNTVISSARAYSGGYSYTGNEYYSRAPGRQFDGVYPAMRANFMLYHGGAGGPYDTAVPIAAILAGSVPCTFYWDWYNSGIGLLAGWQQSTSSYRSPVAGVADAPLATAANRWISVGVAAYTAEVGGYLVLYIDGAEVMAWRGDTRVYASGSDTPQAGYSGYYVAGGGQGYGLLSLTRWENTYWDDLYMDTSDTFEPEAAPPLRRFLPAQLSSAGGSAQWSPVGAATNYDAVRENPSDEAATYTKAGAPGLVDSYTLAPVDIPDDYVVRSIIPVADALKTNAALSMALRLRLTRNGQTTESPDKELPVDYGAFVWERMESDLAGNGWTEADLQAMEIGYRSIGEFE